MERPAVMRKGLVDRAKNYVGGAKKSPDMEYLDIPAFLRRQAD